MELESAAQTPYPVLNERARGWLKFIHRKATTSDDWSSKAWREVYARILDELVRRHTTFWAPSP